MSSAAPTFSPSTSQSTAGTWIVELPSGARTSDGHLHVAAARLLEHAHLPSGIVERQPQPPPGLVKPRHSAQGVNPALADNLQVGQDDIPTSLPIVHWTDPRDQSLCFIKLPARATGWRRIALMVAAVVTLVLGLLGILLPGLPTTP